MFSGSKIFMQLVLRRDRIKLPIWVICLVGTLVAMVPLLKDIYGDAPSLTMLYQTFGTNPAGLFLTGPMDGPNFGSLMTMETILWWGLAVAFMNTLFMVRHTRQNEEMGAQELLLSGQASRNANLVAALTIAAIVNAIVAIGVGLGFGFESSWSASQGWLYGIALGIFGFVWAVIAAIIVQFFTSARTANGVLTGLIGILFALRGIGDFIGTKNAEGIIEPGWVSWLSPFGWMQATRPLTVPEWWPLLLPICFVVIMIPASCILQNKRDVGAGLLPAKKGRARAKQFLATPLGFTWYIQKNVCMGWFIGVVATATMVGALVPQMSSAYEDSTDLKNVITSIGGEGAIVPAFLSAMLAIIVVMVLGYIVQAMGKLRAEESSGHLENLLATQLSRTKWLALHVVVVALGGVTMLLASGVAIALCVNIFSTMHLSIAEYALAALSYTPLLLIFLGGYAFFFGILPRIGGVLLWIYFGFVAFALWLGPIIKLDDKIMDASVMNHMAAVPAQSVAAGPLVALTVAGVVLLLCGAILWRQRNSVQE